MYNFALQIGNKVSNIPNFIIPHSRQKKREKYIKSHRDKTANYFYKDIELMAKHELEKQPKTVSHLALTSNFEVHREVESPTTDENVTIVIDNQGK
jgi:hypothetical protein